MTPPGRLFIALELPSGTKDTLGQISARLKKTGADVKWVEPENIHLTLKFLGDVAADKIPLVRECLFAGTLTATRIKTRLKELGGFPSLGAPRILWAALDDTDQAIGQLAKRLEDALFKIGFKKETRKFQAHVTLGRIRSPLNRLSLIQAVEDIQSKSISGPILLEHVTLFESRLSPKGPAYSVIEQIKLKA